MVEEVRREWHRTEEKLRVASLPNRKQKQDINKLEKESEMLLDRLLALILGE